MERSGLTGRGGAGFPAGRKMRSVAAGPGSKVLVANGSEGEPASRKDRLLLSRLAAPGAGRHALAAFAVGATEAYLVVHRAEEDPLVRLEARDAGAAGRGARPGADPGVGIAGRYVASEQSAIVQHLNGGPGLPTFAPPRTHERGVGRTPTLVNNVETLAHLALIARYGHRWFRRPDRRPLRARRS